MVSVRDQLRGDTTVKTGNGSAGDRGVGFKSPSSSNSRCGSAGGSGSRDIVASCLDGRQAGRGQLKAKAADTVRDSGHGIRQSYLIQKPPQLRAALLQGILRLPCRLRDRRGVRVRLGTVGIRIGTGYCWNKVELRPEGGHRCNNMKRSCDQGLALLEYRAPRVCDHHVCSLASHSAAWLYPCLLGGTHTLTQDQAQAYLTQIPALPVVATLALAPTLDLGLTLASAITLASAFSATNCLAHCSSALALASGL